MWRTPEDCTAVVRVMEDFERIAAAPQQNVLNDPTGRLNFDVTPSPDFSKASKKDSSTVGSFQYPRKRSQDREKDVELFCAKGRISQLENESSFLKTASKRAKIEQQKEIGLKDGELRCQIEKNSELHQRLLYVVEEEKNIREELKQTRKEFDEYKKKSEEKVHSLQRQKLKLSSETEESKEAFHKTLGEMREKLTRQEAENIICQNKLEDSDNQLDYYKKRFSDASRQVGELEEFRSKCCTAEHKMKEMEQKLARRDEAAEVAMTMQSQLAKYYEIECENSKLKEENAYLKATNKSNHLLNEKLESAQNKLTRAEEKLKGLSQIEIEYEKQKVMLKKWEANGNVGSVRSPEDMLQEIARLQHNQVVLLEKQGQASTSAKISSEALRQQSEELVELQLKLSELEEKYNKQSEQFKRANKLLSLVTTERNGCRRLLNSYDSGDSANYAPQLSSRAQQAEEQLELCNNHIEQLQNDLKSSIEKTGEQSLKYNKLKITYDQLKQNFDKRKDGAKSELPKHDNSKEEIGKLEQDKKDLVQRINILEARIEQRNLQGDFDPSKVKVVHFSHNPFIQARQSRSEELERLRAECEALRRKLKIAEEGNGEKSSNVEQIVIDEQTPHEVKDLQAQVSSGERKMQRLKEIFSQKIQEFREACYSLTGYRIDVVKDQQYRLKSMYAERSSDNLLFQVNANGKTMLLETEFSLQMKSLIDNYLIRCNSIPAFLSSVTLELFERQTQMLN